VSYEFFILKLNSTSFWKMTIVCIQNSFDSIYYYYIIRRRIKVRGNLLSLVFIYFALHIFIFLHCTTIRFIIFSIWKCFLSSRRFLFRLLNLFFLLIIFFYLFIQFSFWRKIWFSYNCTFRKFLTFRFIIIIIILKWFTNDLRGVY